MRSAGISCVANVAAQPRRHLLEGLELEAEQLDEVRPWHDLFEHLERGLVVTQLGLGLCRRRTAGEQRSQLSHLGDLVGGKDRRRVAAGPTDSLKVR